MWLKHMVRVQEISLNYFIVFEHYAELCVWLLVRPSNSYPSLKWMARIYKFWSSQNSMTLQILRISDLTSGREKPYACMQKSSQNI